MEAYMAYLMIRFAIIGVVIVGAILAIFVVAVILKKSGKLGKAKDFVEPIIRQRMTNKPGFKSGLTTIVLDQVTKMSQQDNAGRQSPITRQPIEQHREPQQNRD